MNLLTDQPAARKLGVAILLGTALAAVGAWQIEPRRESMDDWEVEDVVAHLHAKGLEFRTLPTEEQGVVSKNRFLTTTDKSVTQLAVVPVFAERLDKWHGTVLCTRVSKRYPGSGVQTEVEGDSYLCVGPFTFFGDPEFRARIADALSDAGGHNGFGRSLR